MRMTRGQVLQIIKEELRRVLREGFYDDDEPEYDPNEEGTGYEYLRGMPNTVQWVDGPVDERWLKNKLNFYRQNFSSIALPYVAGDFENMLAGVGIDPDIVSRYINTDGTSNVTRQTVEALVDALTGPSRRAKSGRSA